jgi:hypothetical protein
LRATNLRDFERPPVVSHLVLETMDSRMHDFGGWGGGELYDVETRLTGGDRIPGGSIPMHELEWSHAEKTVARRAFDKALGKELEALIREAKSRAARIEEPPDLWNLENWLTERRREIDRRYDYRYSALPLVFAHLLRDGRLTEDDLNGLEQEKLDLIRRASAL